MARIISDKTHSSLLKMLKDAAKTVKDKKTLNTFTALIEDLENSDQAIGYSD